MNSVSPMGTITAANVSEVNFQLPAFFRENSMHHVKQMKPVRAWHVVNYGKAPYGPVRTCFMFCHISLIAPVH